MLSRKKIMSDSKFKEDENRSKSTTQSDDAQPQDGLSVMQVLASNVENLLTVTMEECAKSASKTPENPMSSTIEQLFKQLGPALGNELKSWQNEQRVEPTRSNSHDVQNSEQHGDGEPRAPK